MPFDSDRVRHMTVEPPKVLPTERTFEDEKKRRYYERYSELKKQGEQFFPDTVFKDAIASLVIFLILIALAVFVGAPLEERADPSNTAYVPRPEWYFMFLFQMLKYFPGEFEWVGVAVVPGAIILFLFLLPMLDRKWVRHPRQRVLAMNLTAVAVLAFVFLTLQAYDVQPTTAMSMISNGPKLAPASGAVQQPRLTAAQQAGRQVFQSQGCTSCHQLNGTGGQVGPDLTHVGSRHDAAWIQQFIENPKKVNPNSLMPAFTSLSDQDVQNLAQYLATLR